MQIQIPSHTADDVEFLAAHDQHLDALRESLPKLYETARTQVESLPALADAAHACAGFHYVHDPEATQVVGGLRLCQEALVALFASAGTPGPRPASSVSPTSPTRRSRPRPPSTSTGGWTRYFLSLIIGDLDAMQLLCAFPGATLRASPTSGARASPRAQGGVARLAGQGRRRDPPDRGRDHRRHRRAGGPA